MRPGRRRERTAAILCPQAARMFNLQSTREGGGGGGAVDHGAVGPGSRAASTLTNQNGFSLALEKL